MATRTFRCTNCGTSNTSGDTHPKCTRCGTDLTCWYCADRFGPGETQYVVRVDGVPRAHHEGCQPVQPVQQPTPPEGMVRCPYCGGAGGYAAHALGAPGPCMHCAGTGLVPDPVYGDLTRTGDVLADHLAAGAVDTALGMPPDETPDEMVRRLRHGMREQPQPVEGIAPAQEPDSTSTADALEQWLKGLL